MYSMWMSDSACALLGFTMELTDKILQGAVYFFIIMMLTGAVRCLFLRDHVDYIFFANSIPQFFASCCPWAAKNCPVEL